MLQLGFLQRKTTEKFEIHTCQIRILGGKLRITSIFLTRRDFRHQLVTKATNSQNFILHQQAALQGLPRSTRLSILMFISKKKFFRKKTWFTKKSLRIWRKLFTDEDTWATIWKQLCPRVSVSARWGTHRPKGGSSYAARKRVRSSSSGMVRRWASSLFQVAHRCWWVGPLGASPPAMLSCGVSRNMRSDRVEEAACLNRFDIRMELAKGFKKRTQWTRYRKQRFSCGPGGSSWPTGKWSWREKNAGWTPPLGGITRTWGLGASPFVGVRINVRQYFSKWQKLAP